MKVSVVLTVMALALVSCVSMPGPPKGAVFLGERTVGFKAERDRIPVGRYEGRFNSLFFEIERNNLEMFDMVVIFENGQKEKIGTRLVFDEGTRSRVIALEGGERRIRAIEFAYKTSGTWLNGKARILVYGVL